MFSEFITSDTRLTDAGAELYFKDLDPGNDETLRGDRTATVLKRAFGLSRPDLLKTTLILAVYRYYHWEDAKKSVSELDPYNVLLVTVDKIGDLSEIEGFTPINKITNYCKGTVNVAACFNEMNSVIFVEGYDNLSISTYHYILSTYTAAMPQWIDPSTIIPQEKELIMALSKGDSALFVNAVRNLTSLYDLESKFNQLCLEGFFNGRKDYELQSYRTQCEDLQNTIESLENRLTKAYRHLQEARRNYEAQMYASPDMTELVEYILNNPKIRIENYNRDVCTLRFDIEGELINYDPELAESFYDNKRSVIYDKPKDSKITRNDMAMLFKAIFIDEIIKVQTAATFEIGKNMTINALTTDVIEHPYIVPNPHLQHYHCLGENSTAINRALRDGDYILALEQAIYATQNVQFNDLSFNLFMKEDLYTDRYECLLLPGGEIVKPSLAIAYLKEMEGK